jgi:hypothetical protein
MRGAFLQEEVKLEDAALDGSGAAVVPFDHE